MDFEATGIQIIRGEEHIDLAPLPDIFVNIPASEYALLAPLNAKAFLEEDKRTMRYLEPEQYLNCTDEGWVQYFTQHISDYYSPNGHMDYGVIYPLALKAEDGTWQQSQLEAVKNYLLKQL